MTRFLQVEGSDVIHVEHPSGRSWCSVLWERARPITAEADNVSVVPAPPNGDCLCSNCFWRQRLAKERKHPEAATRRYEDNVLRNIHRRLRGDFR